MCPYCVLCVVQEGYAKVHDADVEFVGLTLGDNDAPDYVVDLANE